MQNSPRLLACALLAAVPLLHAGLAWSAMSADQATAGTTAASVQAELPGEAALTSSPAASVPLNANPYLAYRQPIAQVNPFDSVGQTLDKLKQALPLQGQSILPKIKTVYPTGEKPLVVVTFKCPTELIGITPLPTQALHELVNLGLGALNSTNLLAFNVQQVCQ